MSSLRAAAILLLFALLSPEGLALRSSPKKKAAHKGHHRHHKAHKSLPSATPVAVAEQEQKSQETGEAQFGHIQKELVEAWKHKSHMAKLRQTLDAEQKLLSSQQSLVESDVDDASDAAVQQQAAATKNMINDAKVLLHKSRQDALKQTRSALTEAYQIKKTAEHDIEASKLAIEKATKDKAEADKKIKNIAQVIHAATEEAKFFFNQEVPGVGADKASTKSSSTFVKKEEQTARIQKDIPSVQTATGLRRYFQEDEADALVKEAKESKEEPVKEETPLQKVPAVRADKASTKSSSSAFVKKAEALVKKAKEEEEKKTVSVAEKQEPAKPHPKGAELKQPAKEATKTVSAAEKQGPANPQPKKVELKEQVQKTHDSASHTEEDQLPAMASQMKSADDKNLNANHSSNGKKWMPLMLHEDDGEDEQQD